MNSSAGKILNFLAGPVIRHGTYVIQYKDKVQLLEQENGRLGEKKMRIQRKVDIATNHGEIIEIEVYSWLEKVEHMERDIANFLRQEDVESSRCFPGCMCPDLMWRHRMGEEADKRKLDVCELISSGDRLETLPAARSAPFQWEPEFDFAQYYTLFQSRALVFANIIEALKDSGVDLIGVHGPGGAGKTTMVKEVAKEAKKLRIFDKIVIVVVSKEPDTSRLQEDIASQLDLEYKQRTELGRANELQKALLSGKRKILVILDDLWQILDLNAIGIPILGLGSCKLLLTSRREEVFKWMGVRLYFSIGYLEEQEAWELFKKVTGGFGVDELIARKISKRCGGLPIAIVAIGAALKDKEELEWRNALHKLRKSPLKYVEGVDPMGYTPLKWSYDFLKDKDAKLCFLLCCLFPEDVEIDIDDLVRYSFSLGFLKKVNTLKIARNIVQCMVEKLKRSYLLLNGAHKNFVKMHNVIRDLAISVTEEKQVEHESGHDWLGQQQFIVDHDFRKWPKKDAWGHHTAISLRINEDNFPFPSDVFNCPLVHTFVLELGKSSHVIPNDFFQGMKEARVLDLKCLSLELPSSILELDHLLMLRLSHCRLLGDLTTIQNLKNCIEILSFEGSTIQELPQEIGELTHLRYLDLRWCRSLKVIPKGVISNLIHLEELYVTSGFKEWDIVVDGGGINNASIVELKLLTQLIVLHVSISTESFKIMVQECLDIFEKLINFNIFIDVTDGYHFSDRSLNVLEIDRIHHIDDEFCPLMERVEKLRLSNIQDLRYLHGKPQLQLTPSGRGSFCKLTYLDISGCQSMKYLFPPSCAKALQQLQTLRVLDCTKMEQIIGRVDNYHEDEVVTDEVIIFGQLTNIYLGRLPTFRSFYSKMENTTIEGSPPNWTTTAESIFNEKVSFPVLEKLTIGELPVKDIWNKQMIQFSTRLNEISFSQLKNMKVIRCHNLVNVFPSNMLQRLQNLEALHIRDCPLLTFLVEDVNSNIQSCTGKFKLTDVFSKLREIDLRGVPNLMA